MDDGLQKKDGFSRAPGSGVVVEVEENGSWKNIQDACDGSGQGNWADLQAPAHTTCECVCMYIFVP